MKLSKITIAAIAFAVVLLAATALAYAQVPDWELDLRRQLQSEHDCELNYLTDARTFELLGKQTVKARAHCMDKRAFDVTRSGDAASFEVESCEIEAC
ncbi:MAG: hypothetical protein ACR2OM_12095 [Aestuariivirgaceae bacterium]